MVRHRSCGFAADGTGFGRSTCSVLPRMIRYCSGSFTANGAGFRSNTSCILPRVIRYRSCGFTANGAGFRRSASCVFPSMFRCSSFGCTAYGAGLRRGAGRILPRMSSFVNILSVRIAARTRVCFYALFSTSRFGCNGRGVIMFVSRLSFGRRCCLGGSCLRNGRLRRCRLRVRFGCC